MKTLDDLTKARERARQSMTLREGGKTARIAVAMGTCGIAAGARDVLMAVVEELGVEGMGEVAVTQSGCRGLCEREPMMEVAKAGMPTVTYGDLNPERARTIVSEHLGKGVVVEEWVVKQAARIEATEPTD
ncbi:MAG: ferredoxin [Armatimonadota bacterium]